MGYFVGPGARDLLQVYYMELNLQKHHLYIVHNKNKNVCGYTNNLIGLLAWFNMVRVFYYIKQRGCCIPVFFCLLEHYSYHLCCGNIFNLKDRCCATSFLRGYFPLTDSVK